MFWFSIETKNGDTMWELKVDNKVKVLPGKHKLQSTHQVKILLSSMSKGKVKCMGLFLTQRDMVLKAKRGKPSVKDYKYYQQ